MTKIKKGDNVVVMRGKDAGKTGEVLSVVSRITAKKKQRVMVVVKGVNIVKKSQKPNPQFGIKGGFIEFEKPIDLSNVMMLDPKSGKPTRVGFKVENGKKVRISKKSGEIIK